MQIPQPGMSLEIGFVVLSAVMLSGFVWCVRSKTVSVIAVAWTLWTGLMAYSGYLNDFNSMPPRVVLVFVPTMIGICVVAFSKTGKKLTDLPVRFLIGFQAFRIVVELLIHQAVTERIAPPQMTWSGYNLDIITGITALFLIPFANRLPDWVVHVWNIIGLGLLLTVVSVAIVSMPTPFQKLKPDNTWVAFFPFVWLPVVLVSSALLGHLVLFRKLIAENGGRNR